MTIFVTGSTGFIGSHFVRAALAAGHEVIGLRYPGTQPVIPIPDSDRLTWFEGDLNSFLTDPSSTTHPSPSAFSSSSPPADTSAFSFPPSAFSSSALVHLAAAGVNPKHATWEACFETNLNQSLALWRRAAAGGIIRFLICGSCFEYGLSAEHYDFIPASAPLMPSGAYHASKAAATMAAIALAVEQNLQLAVLRPFHVFGEGEGPDRLWPSLHKAALSGEDFPMTAGGQIRDFIPVEQVAQAFLRALDLPSEAFHFSPSTFASTTPVVANIGTGRPQTILEFAEHWWKEWGATGKLLPGAIPCRPNEVMRYVPEVSPPFLP